MTVRTLDVYAAALGHYTSPARVDYVKAQWERPQFTALLRSAALFLRRAGRNRSPLRVVDLGAGAGEGYDLLLAGAARATVRFDYIAVDRSAAMLSVLRGRLSQEHSPQDVSIVESDIRALTTADLDADIVLSVGAPLSHLTTPELADLADRFGSACAVRRTPTVLILDVLGRYSIEWLPLAKESRRPYRMSFFVGGAEEPEADMTFYSRHDLQRWVITPLLRRLRNRRSSFLWLDRSVLVGRHTLTGEYNAALPATRSFINTIAGQRRGTSELFASARLAVSALGYEQIKDPIARTTLYRKCQLWNRTIRRVPRSPDALAKVCHALRTIDQGGSGQGLGHSLTCAVFIE